MYLGYWPTLLMVSLCQVGNYYTQRNPFWIFFNQPEIRLYLPFSDWFGSKRKSVSIQINRKMVNKIWFQVDSTRFKKDFSVCTANIINHCSITIIRCYIRCPRHWRLSVSWKPLKHHRSIVPRGLRGAGSHYAERWRDVLHQFAM